MAFKTQKVNLESRTVTTTLGNGLVIVFELDKCSDDMKMRLALHGAKQKTGDGSAEFSKVNDFSGAFANMQRITDNMYNDVWSEKGMTGTPDLAIAISRVENIDLDDAIELVAGMDDAEYKEMAKKSRIKLEILRIQTERMEARVNAENARDAGC